MAKQTGKAPNVLDTFLGEISKAGRNPRFLTLVAHGVLELLVNTLAQHHCKNGKIIVERRRDYPHSVKLLILHEKGIIDDPTYKLLNSFRDLRNKSVHTVKYEVTDEMLQPFKSVRLYITPETVPDKIAVPPVSLAVSKNYPYLCAAMVFFFWTQHEKVFLEYFEEAKTPGLQLKKKLMASQ